LAAATTGKARCKCWRSSTKRCKRSRWWCRDCFRASIDSGREREAEFEHSLIRERTMEGLKSARARGKSGGRESCEAKSWPWPQPLWPVNLANYGLLEFRLVRRLGAGHDRDNYVAEVAKQFNVHRCTLNGRAKKAQKSTREGCFLSWCDRNRDGIKSTG
jgi:hypothetical protein